MMASAAFTACDYEKDFVQPPMEDYIPHATMVANTTCDELKNAFHQDVNYYNVPVGTKADGSHYIVRGRITSNDEAGNVYKKLAIEDETGGLIFSIDGNNLYESYRYGQEIVVDVTGMYYGNYGAGVQIGSKGDSDTSAPNRMSTTIWNAAVETDGLANVDKLEIFDVTAEELQALHSNPVTLLQWQGRLIRLMDVHFEKPGEALAAASTTNNTRYLVSASGTRIALNTSGYSTFGTSTKAPNGTGNVLALLTNYTSGWQLQLNDLEGLEGFTPWTDEPAKPVDAVGSFSVNFASLTMPDGWAQYQLAGNKDWYFREFDGVAYACMTGYQGTAPFDSWLVSQPVDAAKMTDKILTFETQVNGYGSTTSTFKVFILDGPDPAKANRTELSCTLPQAPASGYSAWTSSGNVSLAAASGVFYIGWQYAATADANYATWDVTNIVVK